MPLHGEYIWDGNYLHGADVDVDDAGHEGVIKEKIVGTYAEDILEAIKNLYEKFTTMPKKDLKKDPNYIRMKNSSFTLEDLDEVIDYLKDWEYGIDPDELFHAFVMLRVMDPENYNSPELLEAMQVLEDKIDARFYGAKHYGDVIIRDSSFEVYGWNAKIARNVLSAIYDLIGHELETDPKEYDQEIDIYDYKTKKSYTMTIRELEQNPMQLSTVPPSVVQTKKGAMSILDPRSRGGSQNWQSVYTSESFASYLQKRDPKLYNKISEYH